VFALTPAERRGALVVVAIFAIGTVHDFARVHAPRAGLPGAVSPGVSGGGRTGDASAESGGRDVAANPPVRPADPRPVDLNHATPAELDRLPGIGPVLAGRIIAHRTRFGPFRNVDELIAVPGIGPALLARLRGLVTVGPG